MTTSQQASLPQLFGTRGPAAGPRLTRWSQRHVQFANEAEASTRAYGTSTRGLHPDLLLLDDVLNDANSLSQHQRELTWRYFAGTLLPMSPGRIVVVGSAIHQDDLLHRLAPRPPAGAVHGFDWVPYHALDEEEGPLSGRLATPMPSSPRSERPSRPS